MQTHVWKILSYRETLIRQYDMMFIYVFCVVFVYNVVDVDFDVVSRPFRVKY